MKQQIIDLWKESFGDSDEFINLFFSRVYKEENTFAIKQNNRVIAALQTVPYQMTFYGTTVTTGYVCGVCTASAERGKGLMKQLMQKAIDEMRRRKYIFSTLIPASEWLFDYYRNFGYVTVFDKSYEIHTRTGTNNPQIHILPITGNSLNQACNYYNRIQQKRACAVLHSAYDFETIRKDCLLDGGNIWMARQNDRICGLAFAVPADENRLAIKEIVYDDISTKTGIIASVLDHYGMHEANVRVPAPTNPAPYGMALILDTETALSLYRAYCNPPDMPACQSDKDLLTRDIFQYNRRKAFMNLMLD
ncbi:MAG: GNAT family N-acetyltransferase [Tannerella sp.]|jgi:predicted acetyltransferase|nr:GNAT family N-acetyltransferase [Tannerella sp.]